MSSTLLDVGRLHWRTFLAGRPGTRLAVCLALLLLVSPARADYLVVSRAEERGVRLEVNEAQDAPMVPAMVLEVPSITRVFHNVLANAVKYSYRGFRSPDRYIAVSWRKHDTTGHLWAVVVKNYGVGIYPDELGLVFRPGYRGRLARSELIGGSGLGLGAAQTIMRLHGGHIELKSVALHDNAFVTTARIVFPDDTRVEERLGNVASPMDRQSAP